MKHISDDQRLEQLEAMEVVKYYISFSANSGLVQHGIIKDYDLFLELAKKTDSGKIYLDTRKALAHGDVAEVKRLGKIARDMLTNNDYEKAPQAFDPKFIGNQTHVMEYRNLIAKVTGSIPSDIKETLL